MALQKRGLGKGLDLLFDDNEQQTAAGGGVRTLRLADIEPNEDQPRREFEEAALQSLADSMREHGVLQPLLVRPIGEGRFQIIAGERRWRAARLAGIVELPALIRELSDQETMEVALVENLQREDLNPVEEAEGYLRLSDEFHMTQEQIATRVAKSRSAVANAMRLLTLPKEALELLKEKKISVGHAKAVLACVKEEDQIKLANMIAETGMNVRKAEAFAAAFNAPSTSAAPKQEMNYYQHFEKKLSQNLGRKVHLSGNSKKGKLEIEYYGNDDLDALLRALGIECEE